MLLVRNSFIFVLAIAIITGVVVGASTFAKSSPTKSTNIAKLYPNISPESSLGGPEEIRNLFIRDKLISIATKFSKKKYIPYIYGGGNFGRYKNCKKCTSCIRKNRWAPVEKRLFVCRSCQRCGVDCSHFVNRIYRDAGIKYPFASTWELGKLRSKDITKHYDLINLGRNLKIAKTGDLLLYKKHITMLLRMTGKNRGDFIHITRFGDRLRIGGIRIEKNRNITRFRGKLKRILRHRIFFEKAAPNHLTIVPFTTPIDRLLSSRI